MARLVASGARGHGAGQVGPDHSRKPTAPLLANSGKTGGCWLNRETESDCLRSVENLEDTIANEAAVFALTAWLGIQFDPPIAGAAFGASEV
jgi:hypothetical protein